MYPAAHAQTHPNKPAYIMASTGEVVTYRQLNERSNRCAHLFAALGLRPGDGIALCLENHPRWFEITWAAQRSGLYYTPISSRLLAPEVAYIVNDCGATVLLTSLSKSDVAQALTGRLPRVHTSLMLDGTVPGYTSYEAAVAPYAAEPLPVEREGQDMLYSSGTTGRPKGVKVPLPAQPAGTPPPWLELLTRFCAMTAATVYLSPAPLYHAAPLRFCMGVHRLGGTTVIMERFDALEALRVIEQYRVTHSQWVPTMFVRMLRLADEARCRYDLSSQQVAIHAAAPCPIPVKEQMLAWWGPILHEYYGGTEGNGITTILPEEWLAHKGSVGRAVLGELHIVDAAGNEVPPGTVGLIYFAGGPRFAYHNDPEKTASAYNAYGWSTLGDIGYMDQEGYLYLTDRQADMIIAGGVNLYPQEVENLLITHPKVADVAVFGVPNPDLGEEVKAVVQPVEMTDAGPALAQELLSFCQQHLARFKCPRSIDFEAELPRHPTGKLYKRLLKERYWVGHPTRLV
jgi:acyl-CoA synthetase (AMP-forming)/AMP-acid ligase II